MYWQLNNTTKKMNEEKEIICFYDYFDGDERQGQRWRWWLQNKLWVTMPVAEWNE